MGKVRQCKDCAAEGHEGKPRPAPHPGPRCATHHRQTVKARKIKAHERMATRTYGVGDGAYERLKEFQGGTCAIHRCRANGTVKRLAFDHNHKTGEVRGLLCGPHNRLIGFSFDDPEVFRSIADYLENPPARKLFGQ